MSPAYVLATLLTGSWLALMARSIWRDLRRAGARRPTYIVAVGAVILAVPSALNLWLILGVPVWWSLPLWLPVTVIYVFPSILVWATGGPLPRWGLVGAAREISARWSQIAASLTITDGDRAWLQARSSTLERWRTPETSELIDLYQAKIADVVQPIEGSVEDFDKRVAARNARIDELTERYWTGAKSP
jgi:hypothetical protein